MARIKAKGTILQLSIATVYTTIAACKSLNGPKAEVGTYDATALDSGVGREVDITGYVDGGEVTGVLWYDPVLATHTALTALLTTPTRASAWKWKFADAAVTVWPFSGPLKSVGPVKADQNEGITADFSVKIDGMVTYP